MTQNPLSAIAAARKQGILIGQYSVCSANQLVIEAAMEKAIEQQMPVLIESTANQVNQFGGYTGMQPADFAAFVHSIADRTGLPRQQLILGGDHLGPLTWQQESEAPAMAKSEELVRLYVLAGFSKIHIDTSMRLADDDRTQALPDSRIASRAVRLIKVAEQAYAGLLAENPGTLAPPPVYVIGSEVPIPGGAQEPEEGVAVTRPAAFRATLDTFRNAFAEAGLLPAWARVLAIVVQPGVEFGDTTICEYDRIKAAGLASSLREYQQEQSSAIFFEGHSTDYQTPQKLREMVQDGIALLKVGPALTFMLREALFALAAIEAALLPGYPDLESSRLPDILEQIMLDKPGNWQKHYHGTPAELKMKRQFSFSDRCRYYLPEEPVRAALARLVSNLRQTGIPLSLLSQYMPVQYLHVRQKGLAIDPESLAKDRVKDLIDEYLFAIRP